MEEANKSVTNIEDIQVRPGFFKRLFRNKLAIIGFIIVVILIGIAIFAPMIATHQPNAVDVTNTFLKPGEQGHILGTDNYGRDLFSRIIYGSRVSLIASLSAVAIGGVVGTILGLIAGYAGGWLDSIIMRIMDGFSAFPFVLLAIFLMTIFGQGLGNVILAIGIGNVPGFTRIVRGQVLAVKEEEFVEVLHSLGASNSRILFLHIFPNAFAPIVVHATSSVAGAIISEATLSFLGLGVEPPTPSWGAILNEGRNYLVLNPEIATFSGLAILITVLGINILGDGIRDALDPKFES